MSRWLGGVSGSVWCSKVMRHLAASTIFLLATSAYGGSATPTTMGLPTDARVSAMTDALAGWAAAPGHHGVSASVVFPDGTVWSAAAGRAGAGEALRSTHLISIGSITKTMTAAVILQLAAEGRLSLDAPISTLLDVRPNVEPAITVRQLLNHTNGLSNYTETSGLSQALSVNPNRALTVDELLGFIGPPQFAPGSSTQYTNTSYLLAGLIAERIGGADIGTLYRARLWQPLGLSQVWLPGAGSAPGPVAGAQSSVGLINPAERPALLSVGHSAFGVFATAADVARWGHSLLAGSVLSGATQSAMRQLVPAAGNIPGESGAGLGIRAYNYLGRQQLGHSGGSTFGSSLLLHDTASRTTVVVLMNQAGGADHFVLAPALLEIALGR